MGVLTAFVLLAAWPAIVGTPLARAIGDLGLKEVEGLITQVDPPSRKVSLWDYLSGRRRSRPQVEGSVRLHQFKLGDFVLARIGVGNHLVTESA